MLKQAYSGVVNQPSPLDGIAPDLVANHSPYTGLGRKLRQADANKLLELLRQTADEVESERRTLEQVEQRVDREAAQVRFETDHVLRFGIAPCDRDEFQSVLEDVSTHGGLTLHEAAAVAHAKTVTRLQSANGVSPSVPVEGGSTMSS